TTLAATPLSVPSMLAVQQELVPTTGPSHLAELMVGGLLKPVDSGEVTLDFVDGVRAELLSYARRADTIRAVQVAVAHFGDRVPAVRRLGMALRDPDMADLPDIAVESLADIAVEAAVMRALSGPYLSRAHRLARATETRSTDMAVDYSA